MKQQTPKLNEKLLTLDQRDKLETYHQTQKQLQTLQDIADMTQEMLGVLDSQKADGSKDSQQMGALLMDMRDSLTTLKDKEAPESPDYAKPVVDAVSKLEKALSASIKSIDVKPVIDAPHVSVATPHVDMRGVEKAVAAIPGAFSDAVSKIDIPKPEKTDYQPLLDAWEGISEQLLSIENATRMKPLPGSIRVSNFEDIGGLTFEEDRVDTSGSTVASETFVKGVTTCSSSGDNTVLTPASGSKIRLYFFGYSAGAGVLGVLASLRFGANTAFDKHYVVAPGDSYDRNMESGDRYIEGEVDEALIINLSAAQTIYVNYEVDEISQTTPIGDSLLLEDGSYLLLESGDHLLLE